MKACLVTPLGGFLVNLAQQVDWEVHVHALHRAFGASALAEVHVRGHVRPCVVQGIEPSSRQRFLAVRLFFFIACSSDGDDPHSTRTHRAEGRPYPGADAANHLYLRLVDGTGREFEPVQVVPERLRVDEADAVCAQGVRPAPVDEPLPVATPQPGQSGSAARSTRVSGID